MTIPAILTATAAEFSVTVADLTGRDPARGISFARIVAMHVMRTESPPHTITAIGAAVGGRDGSFINRAIARALVKMDADQVERIRARAAEIAAVAPPVAFLFARPVVRAAVVAFRRVPTGTFPAPAGGYFMGRGT